MVLCDLARTYGGRDEGPGLCAGERLAPDEFLGERVEFAALVLDDFLGTRVGLREETLHLRIDVGARLIAGRELAAS